MKKLGVSIIRTLEASPFHTVFFKRNLMNSFELILNIIFCVTLGYTIASSELAHNKIEEAMFFL